MKFGVNVATDTPRLHKDDNTGKSFTNNIIYNYKFQMV